MVEVKKKKLISKKINKCKSQTERAVIKQTKTGRI